MDLVKLIELPSFTDDLGDLVVIDTQSQNIPFNIKRVFNVISPKNTTRGRHAHRECSQLLICTIGSIEVVCDNGIEVSQYLLNKSNLGLLISPGIWSHQLYTKENTVLTVLCDHHYSEDDYIRKYEIFLKFVNN